MNQFKTQRIKTGFIFSSLHPGKITKAVNERAAEGYTLDRTFVVRTGFIFGRPSVYLIFKKTGTT